MGQAEQCVIDGVAFRLAVEGEGEPVLLLHGGYTNLAVWDDHTEAFAAQYKVIRYDQRGYGMSDEPTKPFSYYEDIRSILDYCGVSSAHIVASSFGGAAAIDFTLQYPERINKLILVGPSIHGAAYPFRMTWEGLMDYLRVRRLGIDAAGEIFVNKKFWRYLVPQEESRKQQFKRLYAGNAGFYRSKPSLHRPLLPHAIHRLEEIRTPTLIIEPQFDLPFNVRACRILHDRIEGARIVNMDNCGHFPHLESPDEFTGIVVDFLNGK